MRRSLASNQRGQVAVEYILFSVVAMALISFVASEFRNNELMKKFVSQPWGKVAGMIESGNWAKDAAAARKLHPAQGRQVSLKPIRPRGSPDP